MHSYFGGENISLQMVSWNMEKEMGCGWNCPWSFTTAGIGI